MLTQNRAIAAIGGGFAVHSPYMRPFSLVDLSIQYPYIESETIPTWLLIVVSVIAPAIIIFGVCLLLVPGPAASTNTPRSQIWRRKLWEWNSTSPTTTLNFVFVILTDSSWLDGIGSQSRCGIHAHIRNEEPLRQAAT